VDFNVGSLRIQLNMWHLRPSWSLSGLPGVT
jgi:hypothetical protein